MSMNDTIADMLTRIRNGQRAHLPKVSMPYSRKLEDVCHVLEREGFIRGTRIIELDKNKRDLEVQLKYFEGKPVIRQIKRISSCGRRTYASSKSLPKIHNGLGIAILSTSKGVLSDFEARQQHVGGEVLCSVF